MSKKNKTNSHVFAGKACLPHPEQTDHLLEAYTKIPEHELKHLLNVAKETW